REGLVITNGVRAFHVGGLWHLSSRRATDAGHTPSHSLYFGRDVEGNYNVGNTAGWVTSPVINLTTVNNAVLSFKYFLQTEINFFGDETDAARLLVSEIDGVPTQ